MHCITDHLKWLHLLSFVVIYNYIFAKISSSQASSEFIWYNIIDINLHFMCVFYIDMPQRNPKGNVISTWKRFLWPGTRVVVGGRVRANKRAITKTPPCWPSAHCALDLFPPLLNIYRNNPGCIASKGCHILGNYQEWNILHTMIFIQIWFLTQTVSI